MVRTYVFQRPPITEVMKIMFSINRTASGGQHVREFRSSEFNILTRFRTNSENRFGHDSLFNQLN